LGGCGLDPEEAKKIPEQKQGVRFNPNAWGRQNKQGE